MANSMLMTSTGSIQIADTNTPGAPVFYNRSFTASISELNFLSQTINLTATFNVPITGTNPYSLIYVRNLMPSNFGSTLLITIPTATLQLGGGAWLFLANPGLNQQTPLASMNLSSFSNIYPLLCEYAFSTTAGAV